MEHGDESVGGVLLAAGMGTRFEAGNKLLAAVDGVPIVRRAARSLVVSSVAGVTAVVGHDAEAVRGALAGLDLSIRHNPDYERGQSTSVGTGVEAARQRGWDACLFALGDMPAVSPATVDTLVGAYREGRGTVLAPAYDGMRGNPVLFDGRHYGELTAVTGDRGGRAIIEEQGTLVPVDDPGVRRDVDRTEDLDGLGDSP
ncbi:MAG: NTP transferase domain-containing protein [Salinirussus sp.]